eukprot:3823547-Pyramimonas_sp.AAC.1
MRTRVRSLHSTTLTFHVSSNFRLVFQIITITCPLRFGARQHPKAWNASAIAIGHLNWITTTA